MNLATGIGPLDARVAGFRRGGAYLLTGEGDQAKLAFLLQFLDAGLREGERAALLSAAAPEDLLSHADHFGFELRKHWSAGNCLLLGFKGEYPRRVVHTPDPNEAFDELQGLVEPAVHRIAVDPGSFLWSTRAGTAMAHGFVEWVEATGAAVAASVASGLADRPDPSTEWVLQRAAGVLHFARLSNGLFEIDVRRFSPPPDAGGPVTLELAADRGLVAPSGRIERRRTDRATVPGGTLLLIELGAPAPEDLAGWLGRDRETERLDDGMVLVRRLQDGPVGLVCLYVERSRTDEAIEVIRTARGLTTAPLLLLSDHELRSGDRAAALDAGADDVLSDGIDLTELDARIRRARESARHTATEATTGRDRVSVEGMLEPGEFRRLLRERLAEGSPFSFLRIDPGGVPEFGSVLLHSVRAESGDLVARHEDRYEVLLQDARAQQAEAFLHRVQVELRQRGQPATVEAEILASPDRAERIREMTGP